MLKRGKFYAEDNGKGLLTNSQSKPFLLSQISSNWIRKYKDALKLFKTVFEQSSTFLVHSDRIFL